MKDSDYDRLVAKITYDDRLDPDDPEMRLVTIRLPLPPELRGNYGPFAYVGERAGLRLLRLSLAYMNGQGLLTHGFVDRQMRSVLAREDALEEKKA